jgi:4-aminobutyrate aminotransferase-like enzyme/Ser/Thr protein kinase RdoA (MazF antagonist)
MQTSPRPALVETAPKFTPADAVRIAQELFGTIGSAQALTSERDQNFLLTTASAEQFVLKIANSVEEREILEMQNAAMRHLSGKLGACRVQQLCRARDNSEIAATKSVSGARHFVRLVTYLPGIYLADAKPHTAGLLEDLGAAMAHVDLALANFEHPRLDRKFHWDLQRATHIRAQLEHISDTARCGLVARWLDRFEAAVLPELAKLPKQAIHNDANDCNVLVTPRASLDRRVIGLLDFGDMVRAPAVCDLAVACAYALLGKANALAAAADVIRGYHSVRPLSASEIALLFDLICARLCLSVTISAWQYARNPANDYLRISEDDAWDVLENFSSMPAQWPHYYFRAACGWEPCARSARLRAWLRENAKSFAPVMRPDPKSVKVRVFDLSAASLDFPPKMNAADALESSEYIFGEMRRAGAAIGVGRYNEARLCYRDARYQIAGGEPRTVHIGLDLFQPAASPVFAPLDAAVHSFADNGPADYGPTIILEHDAGGEKFWTLYGHLSRASLENLRAGQRIARGEKIGALGDPHENGGWTPHLHLQIIADNLEKRGDFPGVAAPSERAVWLSISPDPNLIVQIPAEHFPAAQKSHYEILAARHAHIGASLSLSYRRPLHIVRGFMQHLYDADGLRYLDAVNNVPHAGHSHPRVVEAVARQMAVLNTNTRYLYAQLAEYSERLTALLPEPLIVCFLVSSGSEANELALRLARAHTRRKDIVVVEGGYHGNTTSLIEVSHYKFAGPGGEGKAEHVHVAPVPDTFRGPYKASDPDAGKKYAQYVAEAITRAEAAGRKTGAFLMDSVNSSAGMILPPPDYLAEAYRHVRAAGGVCIADEVQGGFGRLGTHFWGFEAQGVVPDIVTLGKPIGNGYPLGAVITTREIADSFATGMEFFSTYGGNPVACAAGLAVLDVLREENLQANARAVGEQLLDGLRALQKHAPLIGDIRGSGFFIGVELVRDPVTLEPADEEAAFIAEVLRDRGILIGTESTRHNVLKIRPPMCFSSADAGELLAAIEEAAQ